jgi:D-xylose transport system permease protein
MSETVEGAEAVEPTDGEAGASRPAQTMRRLIQGDLASLRVVIGLALIWAIFQFENDRFLSAQNLTNLGLQITAIGLISVGVVYVLLLGEIDLSVGAVSGLAAAVMAVLNVKHGWNPYLAIAAAIAVGCAIGLLQGSLFTRFGIPSFVVTLAGLLAWQGALLQVLGSTGSLNITDPKITGLANTFYSDAVGWTFCIVGLLAYGAVLAFGYRRRVAAGLTGQSFASQVVRFVLVAAIAIVAVLVFNSDRGVPLALLILLGFVIGMEYVVKRTGFGRHVFAVGGNSEAARRAGIRVNGVRIAVFAIAGSMAAIGGIMAASRLLAVNQNSGGNELLLLAIAGPVIAGTSLFGGRGSVWTALLGALVIGSISNGMDLLALSSAVKFMVTGGVLLLAVIVDAVARQQREASGRV